MFKSFIRKTAAIFGEKIAELRFERVTEDKYDTYGVSQVLHKQSVDESAEFIKKHISNCLLFGDKRRMYGYVSKCLGRFDGQPELLFFEFGVHTGTSINFLSANTTQPFYGFDTFEGMPEEWRGWNIEKGQFSMQGQFPKVNSNVTLIKGLIQDTLPLFLEQNPGKKIAFIHIDTDIYSAAKVILQLCKSRLVKTALCCLMSCTRILHGKTMN